MNKKEALQALNTIYSVFHANTALSGEQHDQYRKLASELGKFINELPEPEEIKEPKKPEPKK